MKISEVINKLQEIQDNNGDVEVYYNGICYQGNFDDELFKEVFILIDRTLILNN